MSREILKDKIKYAGGKIGRKFSDKAKEKLSKFWTGRPKPWLKGKPLSVEHRKKFSEIRSGIPKSEEFRKRVSATLISKREILHLWKGGVSSLKVRLRGCFQYRQWRSDIFLRDNFTCQICSKRGNGVLNADHYPKSFASILEEYNIKTFEEALICEELWNLNNGRTLCIDCHKLTDTFPKN